MHSGYPVPPKRTFQAPNTYHLFAPPPKLLCAGALEAETDENRALDGLLRGLRGLSAPGLRRASETPRAEIGLQRGLGLEAYGFMVLVSVRQYRDDPSNHL